MLIAVVGFGTGVTLLSSFTGKMERENTNSSGTCYCTHCENQPLSQRLEKEYENVTCSTCNGTGKQNCSGWDGTRNVMDRWTHCPNCHQCKGKGWYERLVRQYYIYYCPRCKREYSGC